MSNWRQILQVKSWTVTKAQELADKTMDAYSFNRYTMPNWIKAVNLFLSWGLSEDKVEWILRSKHMRWTMDIADMEGYGDDADPDIFEKELLPAFEKYKHTLMQDAQEGVQNSNY